MKRAASSGCPEKSLSDVLKKKTEDLEVEIFEWPDRFLVEALEPDRDYVKFFPDAPIEIYPHFIDLGEEREGWCSCRDFRFNVEPYLVNESHRAVCVHIMHARRWRDARGSKPKALPSTIYL